MKRITASEARKSWFRLLDEVAAGEVVVIERRGRRIVLRREAERAGERSRAQKDYREVLQVPDAERADEWSWEWQGPDTNLALKLKTHR